MVALTGSRAETGYFGLVLAGRLLCTVGDVFLIFFTSPKLFLAGLVAFLTGHILYAAAFFLTSRPGMLAAVAGLCGLAVSGAIFAWLRPHLGKMLGPVVAYMAVITVMVTGAASFMGDKATGFSAGLLVFAGAILFYLSDICVARQQFVVSHTSTASWGCPCITRPSS